MKANIRVCFYPLLPDLCIVVLLFYAAKTDYVSFSPPLLSQRSVLVDSPMSLSSSVLSHMTPQPAAPSSVSLATVRRGGGKPAALASVAAAASAKKGKKKKDPNEPPKPVSAYALFFRDTQAAIKGQNPNASFGEVSKIVASMWDSLAEEQKQVSAHMLTHTQRQSMGTIQSSDDFIFVRPNY